MSAERHLPDELPGIADAVDDEQHVADVHGDVAADRRVEGNVAHRRAPRAVEVQADELAAGVQHRRSGVAARRVVRRQEADRHRAAAVDLDAPASVILRRVEVA